MVQRYAHLSPSHRREAIERLAVRQPEAQQMTPRPPQVAAFGSIHALVNVAMLFSRVGTPIVARLEPYRPRCRAGIGTLVTLTRLPGASSGQNPPRLSGYCASTMGVRDLYWSSVFYDRRRALGSLSPDPLPRRHGAGPSRDPGGCDP